MLPTNLKNCRVLYVEDEPLIAMDGEAMLRDIGFTNIVTALSLDDARSALQENQFDLAIMDINLGGGQTSMPLVEVLKPLGTRIVLASGYTAEVHLGSTRVEKPFDEGSLLRAVLQAMQE